MGLWNDKRANMSIAIGIFYIMIAIITAKVMWVSMAPVIDAFDQMADDMDPNSKFYDQKTVDRIHAATGLWPQLLWLTIGVSVIYAIVLATRRQTYSDIDEY